MYRTVRAALAAGLVLSSVSAARAFTLASPPLDAPTGGFFECFVFNHSSSKTMTASIAILNDQGVEVNSSNVVCNGTLNTLCFRVAAGEEARQDAQACRFDIKGVGKGEARAAVRVFDATFQQMTTLEAR